MTSLVYFNDKLLPETEVHLSLLDRAYLFGEGLFETLCARKGKVPFFNEHFSRLQRGAQALGFQGQLEALDLEPIIQRVLKENHLQEAYVRVQCSRLNRDLGGMEVGDLLNIAIWVRPLAPQASELRALLCQEFRVGPRPLDFAKTSNYLLYLHAKAQARKAGFDEAILLNQEARVVEGASSNIFIWQGGRWLTPALTEGPLPGITRGVVLSLMKKSGIAFSEGKVSLNEVLLAEEVMLTNSIWGPLPLVHLEAKKGGRWKLGPQYHKIRELYEGESQRRLS